MVWGYTQEKLCALVQPILILQTIQVDNICASDDFTCPVETVTQTNTCKCKYKFT